MPFLEGVCVELAQTEQLAEEKEAIPALRRFFCSLFILIITVTTKDHQLGGWP